MARQIRRPPETELGLQVPEDPLTLQNYVHFHADESATGWRDGGFPHDLIEACRVARADWATRTA